MCRTLSFYSKAVLYPTMGKDYYYIYTNAILSSFFTFFVIGLVTELKIIVIPILA